MNAAGQTICLNMIVRNEAPVIVRCLESVRAIIDRWVIVDTGSTDGTQAIIRDYFATLPGELYERPWQDFAHNRSEALSLARGEADYTLIIDADDTLDIPPGASLPALTADSYTLEINDTATIYRRTQLVRSSQPWRYEGVLHEYLTCDTAETADHLSSILMRRNHDGARRKDPQTYRRDAAVLEAALRTETNPFLLARYRFYLAQSYRDCGEKAKAAENYLIRSELGYWQEEVFISLYSAAQLQEQLDHPENQVIDTYLRASDALPSRIEALHGASRYCRLKGRNAEGYEIARRGIDVKMPDDALFLEPWIYDYGILDEYAVNAYWAQKYRDSLDANLKILSRNKLAGDDQQRIIKNAGFAAEKLPRDAKLGSLGADGFIEQHVIGSPRNLHTRLDRAPKVLVSILAKQKESSLPLYLDCIEALDYPKSSIVLYVRTNNNTDNTRHMLRDWIARVGHLYAAVEFDAADVATKVERFGVHEWNPTRFRVLGHIRNISLRRALEHDCAYYFVADVDNFVRPCTLRELVALNLPICAPLLRSISATALYANYHAEVDAQGYYADCDQYFWLLNRWIRGVVEVPVVHTTYLIRADVLNQLTYEDETDRFEYVVFSDSARKAGIPQYLDTRQVYGYITFDADGLHHVKNGVEQARALLHNDLLAQATTEICLQTNDTLAQPEAPTPSARSRSRAGRTLVFCTSYATSAEQWQNRYRRWLNAIERSDLQYDQILMVDDGSPLLPDWPDMRICSDADGMAGIEASAPRLMYRFDQHLGRNAVFDFPGWYRSFAFAGRYAQAQGFDKVIHIESDSFLIGARTQAYCNAAKSGWAALWCPLYGGFPESAIQIIAGDAIQRFARIGQTHPHDRLIGREFELQLPFDIVEKTFNGNRYGEALPFIPGNAEYAVQVPSDQPEEYYWWLQAPTAQSDASPRRTQDFTATAAGGD